MRLTSRPISLAGLVALGLVVAGEAPARGQVARTPAAGGGYVQSWSGYVPANAWAGYRQAAPTVPAPAPAPVVAAPTPPTRGWSGYVPANAWRGYNPAAAWRGYVPVNGYTYRAPTTTRSTVRGPSTYRSDPAGRPIAQAKPWLRNNPWSYSR